MLGLAELVCIEPAGKTPGEVAQALATALAGLGVACAALRDRVSRSEERAAERDERLDRVEQSEGHLRGVLAMLQGEKQTLLESVAQHKAKVEALATSQLVRCAKLEIKLSFCNMMGMHDWT
jgi:predicted nuclease with TOPRIM domain